MGNQPAELLSRNEELKKLHEEGVSYNELAKKYDISIQRVHQLIKNYKSYGKRNSDGWRRLFT